MRPERQYGCAHDNLAERSNPKWMLPAYVLLTATLPLIFGACSYLKAGQWDDDSRIWGRAFNGDVPTGWSVVHSRYWRSTHFTYEGGYYFGVKVSAQIRESLERQPDLIKYETNQPTKMDGPCATRPNWFAPKPPTSYDAWRARGGTGNYRLLIDKETPEVFFSDCQF